MRRRVFGRCLGGENLLSGTNILDFSLYRLKKRQMWRHFLVNWVFTWRRPLFVWENELVQEVMEDLEGFRGCQGEDTWRWRLDSDGRFTVKSMYVKLEGLLLEEGSTTLEQRKVFSRIWKSVAPSKVVAFSWKLLHNRIPTKVNLSHWQVLSLEISLNCVMCEGELETANHLMLHCAYVMP